MNESFSENLYLGFQRVLPLLVSILLLLISYIPMDSFVAGKINPVVSIACVYFWLMHRPDLFNLTSVTLLGLVEDVLSAAPFGSNLFALLLAFVIITNLSKYFNAKPFVMVWYGFGALTLIVFFARWFLVSVYYGQFLPVQNLFFSYLFTVASYPILSMFNVFIQNAFIREDV